ncbi:hypothetical protein ID1059_05340 [Helicobacter pylori]
MGIGKKKKIKPQKKNLKKRLQKRFKKKPLKKTPKNKGSLKKQGFQNRNLFKKKV